MTALHEGRRGRTGDDARVRGLPAAFRRDFGPLLGAAPWASIASLVESYWALRLAERPILRAHVVAMVARCAERPVVAWIEALVELGDYRRVTLAELLLETGAFMRAVDGPRALVRRLDELCDDRHYRERAWHLLDAVARGRSAGYALDGFELANEHEPEKRLEQHGDTDEALAAVRRAMAVIGTVDVEWRQHGFALLLWERCGQVPGFAEVLAELPWNELGAEGSFHLADVLASIVWIEDESVRASIWALQRKRVGAIVACLQGLDPSYRATACRHLDALSFWDRDARAYARALERYLELLPRLCAEPLARGSRGRNPLASLTRLSEANWRWIQRAPMAAWRELDQACQRTNDTELISLGLWTMASFVPRLTARAFATETRALLRTAKTLGCMPAAMRERVLETIERTQLFCADPATMDLPALIRLLDTSGSAPAASLVSRRLRDHARGLRRATPARQDRDRTRIARGWDRVLLGRVDRAAMERLATNLRLPQVPGVRRERHALQFLSGTGEHRRALRKLLGAHFAGDRDYPTSHPENQRWLAAHPAIDARVWSGGIELRRRTESHGEVVIGLERDPLEVLRMGTHVGSCFGLGGSFAYSAVAVALDVNKQVVYCRDARGTFLARQMVALSEAERLHCYEIYPTSVVPELHAAFHEFDRLLSTALGAPLYLPDATDEDDGDHVALLLARNCYFDQPIATDLTRVSVS